MTADVRWKQRFFNSLQALAQLDASFQPATVNQREQERPIQLDVSKPNDKPKRLLIVCRFPTLAWHALASLRDSISQEVESYAALSL